MRETQRIVSEIPWSNESFAIALTYINWETDAIVGRVGHGISRNDSNGTKPH